MRKLVVFLFAVFLALQGAVSMAREPGPCCEGCHDMSITACASTSCPACIGQVPDMQGLALPRLAPSQPPSPDLLARAGRISFEIWKPPW
ncbi:MAG: hypothetical protein JSS14_04940 [Proteobacteria bacterium]|nr:hypothetical protein [Pseudomonadota bacterium]